MYKNKISISIGIVLIIIFLLYHIKLIKSIPEIKGCNTDIFTITCRNFSHVDIKHLLVNLLSLWVLSRIENEMGLKSFIWLIAFLIIFNTLTEYLLLKIFKNVDCGIGFSGILYGLITWEIISKNNINVKIILGIIILVSVPSIKSGKISLIGHGIGALSGIISSLLWKHINKIDTKLFLHKDLRV